MKGVLSMGVATEPRREVNRMAQTSHAVEHTPDVETARPEPGAPSFAETALRMSGKSDEEARRTGAVDAADDHVERMFAPQYQTVNSPIHRAVWDRDVPLELFAPPTLDASHRCDAAMTRSIDVVRRHFNAKTMYAENGKLSQSVIHDLGSAGYWGMLVDPAFGGQGAPFVRFSRFLTRIATYDAMVAGLASVHGCIGAVDPLRSFGTPQQKAEFLPRLASGSQLSGFALTEPCAGSDLTALRTRAELVGDHFEVTGEKLFITNAIPGRIIGLVVKIDDKPAVLIAELPTEETDQFQIVPYGLHALRRAHNNGLRFNRFRVPRENLLHPPIGDGLTIAYHGLNLGRLALCAAASGVMRCMLANLLPWADFRRTYGAKIATRELVKRRIARLAGLIAASDALVQWGSRLIDQGYRGELECMIAKIFGSEAQKEAAIDLLMKTHGGRSFLKGHPFGDNIHDFLAPLIYEGEGEMLGMAFFKTLVKNHGLQFFEPIGRRLQERGIRQPNMANPLHAWALRRELWTYSKWMLADRVQGKQHGVLADVRAPFSMHIEFAIDMLQKCPREISGTMRKHQLKLADRQCRIAELSQRVQDVVTVLVTALWGQQQSDEASRAAADIACQDLVRKLVGGRPSDAYFRACGKLADMVINGGFEAIAECPRYELMMTYNSP